MTDIPKLIDTILSQPKFASSKTLADKVYRDELIITTAAQAAGFMPSRYREMRKLANSLYFASEARIFYEQARFMADFEDDFTFEGEFSRYFPTYHTMSDRQLRGYFAWRTKVRRGVTEPTSLSFVFVYIYELLNLIGVNNAAEGFDMLRNFWTAYRQLDAKIDAYVKLWLQDYVVYYRLDQALLADLADEGPDRAVLTLMHQREHTADEIFAALCALSTYDLRNSRFFKQYPDAVKNVVCGVFGRLTEHYAKKGKKSVCEKYIGRVYASPYVMFKAAVFYHQKQPADFIYAISDLAKIQCRDGRWSCERFYCYKGKQQQIGMLLKTIDYLMRRHYNFKSVLKADPPAKMLGTIIDREIENYRAGQRQAAARKIEIDVSKLQGIRTAALETQNKLIIEEVVEMDVPETLVPQPVAVGKAVPLHDCDLADAEASFMQCLLNGQGYDDLLKSQGVMLSVLVDAINDKLFGRFGDTVIVFADERPVLVEDYLEDLERMLAP